MTLGSLSFTIITKDYQLKTGGIMCNTMENLKNKLKESGLKITPQSRAIINILIGHENRHLSSEES